MESKTFSLRSSNSAPWRSQWNFQFKILNFVCLTDDKKTLKK